MTATVLKQAESGLESLFNRAVEVRTADAPDAYLKQRIARAGNALDRAGQLAARIGICNEAMAKFTEILYSADADGTLANIDSVTWRIRTPAPWGRSGWRMWGLRAWEADVLRSILIERSRQQGGRPALFDYNDQSRTWHLNISDYKSYQVALFWLEREGVTLKQWRSHAEKLSAKAAKRMARSRRTAVRATA